MGRGDRSGVQRRQGLGGGRFRVEREVQLDDFTKWLERAGGSQRDVIQRQRIRIDSRYAAFALESASLEPGAPAHCSASLSITFLI
jgi:hypothetical protein